MNVPNAKFVLFVRFKENKLPAGYFFSGVHDAIEIVKAKEDATPVALDRAIVLMLEWLRFPNEATEFRLFPVYKDK